MAYRKIDSFKADLRSPHGLRMGDDEVLWLYDGTTKSIVRIDVKLRKIGRRFHDESLCSFGTFGEFGVIGTWDGRIGLLPMDRFRNDDPKYVTVREGGDIRSIDYDPESKAIYALAGNQIYRLAANGDLRCIWQCWSPAPFSIRWIARSRTLWCAGRGLEIIDFDRRDSITIEPNAYFKYVNVAASPGDEVACFGGDVDIFSSRGELLKTIDCDSSKGLYRPDGRLILSEVKFTEAGVVASREDYDVISLWDSFAMNPAGTRLITLGRGMLSVFAIE